MDQIESIFLAAFFFPAVAAVLIFLMKYVSAVLQAGARVAQDEAYRDLAAKAAAAQAENTTALAAIGTTLADIQSRIASVEKILKEVE